METDQTVSDGGRVALATILRSHAMATGRACVAEHSVSGFGVFVSCCCIAQKVQ